MAPLHICAPASTKTTLLYIYMRKRASVYNHYTPRTRTSSSFFFFWPTVEGGGRGLEGVANRNYYSRCARHETKKKEDERTIKNTKVRRKTTRGPDREKGWWWLLRASFVIIVVRRAPATKGSCRGVVRWRRLWGEGGRGMVYTRTNGYRETIRRDNEKTGNN